MECKPIILFSLKFSFLQSASLQSLVCGFTLLPHDFQLIFSKIAVCCSSGLFVRKDCVKME